MTIPKNKGLKKITVDNIEYYYSIRIDYQKNELIVAIGKVSEPQKRIKLSAKHVDFWVVFPNIEETKDNEIDIVTPKLIKRTIKFAKENGWEKLKKGKTLKVNLENNILALIE